MWKEMLGQRPRPLGLMGMILVAALGLSPGTALSASWQMELWVRAGVGENRLMIGQQDSATERYDSQWEVNAFLPRDKTGAQLGDIEAYFSHPEWGLAHVYYWQDLRGPSGGKKTWSLTVNARLPQLPVEIRWKPAEIPVEVPLSLIDEETGGIIDMHSADHYPYSGDTSRSFRIEATLSADPPPPPPPSPVIKGARRGRIATLLQWNGVGGDVIGYNVYRSVAPGEGYVQINSELVVGKKPKKRKVEKVIYLDKGLAKGKYYYIATSASSAGAESSYSNEVMVNITGV